MAVGDTVSALRVGMYVGRSRLECDGPCDRWRIRCHCGREAWRAAASIRLAIRRGRGIHCDTCAAEVRAIGARAALARMVRSPRGAAQRRAT